MNPSSPGDWEYVIHVWCDDVNSPYRRHKQNATRIARFGYGPPDTPARILLSLGAVDDIGPSSWQLMGVTPRSVRAAQAEALAALEGASEEALMDIVRDATTKLETAWAGAREPRPTATRTLHFLDGTPGADEADVERGEAYVKYTLRCPRCPLNATLREHRLRTILDEVRDEGRDLVSLGWLAAETALK